jgi:uncharacterized protein
MCRMKTSPTLTDLQSRRNQIMRIAAAHGAHNVRVFGSMARGYARPDSDVDLLVEFEPGRTVLDLSGLILDLQDALGVPTHLLPGERIGSPGGRATGWPMAA